MESKEKELRVPRIFGITQLMDAYHKSSDIDKAMILTNIKKMFMQHWFLNEGNICGTPFSSGQLVGFLDCDMADLQMFMRNQVVENGQLFDPEKSKEIMTGLLSQQMLWAMEDRMQISNQVEILRNSQGDTYKPYISSEVNKALKLKLESGQSLANLVKSTGGGNTFNILTQINTQDTAEESAGYVTYNEALNIIQSNQDQNAIQADGESIKLIENNYDLTILPEVRAVAQEGVNTEKEGTKLIDNEIKRITDDYKGTIELMSKGESLHHETRRQQELGEDLDDDDPEMMVYEEL